jgi:hypothetical protein
MFELRELAISLAPLNGPHWAASYPIEWAGRDGFDHSIIHFNLNFFFIKKVSEPIECNVFGYIVHNSSVVTRINF